MRLFIAANCGEQFRRLLATQLDAWRAQLRIAWSRPQTWHLTLDFLGEVPVADVPALQDGLRVEAARHQPFQVRPGQLGGFPSLNRPRVLFLHMDSGGALEELAAGIRFRVDTVLPDGDQDRKAFRAHLTIARIKRPLLRAQQQLLSQIQFAPWEPLTLDTVRLVKSELSPQGAQHTDLAVIPLGPGR